MVYLNVFNIRVLSKWPLTSKAGRKWPGAACFKSFKTKDFRLLNISIFEKCRNGMTQFVLLFSVKWWRSSAWSLQTGWSLCRLCGRTTSLLSLDLVVRICDSAVNNVRYLIPLLKWCLVCVYWGARVMYTVSLHQCYSSFTWWMKSIIICDEIVFTGLHVCLIYISQLCGKMPKYCMFLLCSFCTGGFSQMYRCVCDWLGLPYKEEVQWVSIVFIPLCRGTASADPASAVRQCCWLADMKLNKALWWIG